MTIELRRPAGTRRPGRSAVVVGGCVMGLLLGGCANDRFSTVREQQKLGESDVLLTSAELRATISTPATYTPDGRLKPTRIVCAEPSPDIAKAVQNSFGLGAGLGVDIPTQVSGSAAVSVAQARAEAAAQLGERLATIQLLRDGLFRACEAYANGAFSETTYALLLSRYDDTMVTMLAAELAAGNFGRQLATAGGSVGSDASSSASLESALGAADLAKQQLEEAEGDKEEAEKELVQAETDLTDAQAAGDSETSEEEEAVAEKEEEVEEAERKVKLAIESAAKATATAAAAVGGITQTANKDVALVVHEIQRKYIENINADSLMVACVIAMSKPDESVTAMRNFCAGTNGRDGFVQAMVDENGRALERAKLRPIQDRDKASLKAAIEAIKEMKQDLDGLNDGQPGTVLAGGR